MYLAVVSMVIGQALLFGNLRVLAYGLFAFLITHVFVLTYEEPKLRKTFGAEYETFCANVPRWIPRVAPWRNESQPTA
jgi:protein-S-isoprenylcysteine O-methyltransferase Ste14